MWLWSFIVERIGSKSELSNTISYQPMTDGVYTKNEVQNENREINEIREI